MALALGCSRVELTPSTHQVLYNKDCISDQAIIYWHQKGSKPQGRQHFLQATQPLVKVSYLVTACPSNKYLLLMSSL